MTSFEFKLDPKSELAARFMADVRHELRKAVVQAKKSDPTLTQAEIARRIGTGKATITRQLQGLENLTARRMAEILWAVGYLPEFRAVKEELGNEIAAATKAEPVVTRVKPAQTAPVSHQVITPNEVRSTAKILELNP